jgi:phosphate/sulfate permease
MEPPPTREVVGWGLGCLIAAVSMVGILILVLLVAVALSPPTWVQVLLGVALALGGAAFAWLVATALGQKESQQQDAPDRESRQDPAG